MPLDLKYVPIFCYTAEILQCQVCKGSMLDFRLTLLLIITDHNREYVSVGPKSRTVYVALREPPRQLQTATVQTTQQQVCPL